MPIDYAAKEIPLTQGKVALIDDKDYARVIAAGKWHARMDHGRWYAVRNVQISKGKRTLYMHRFILGLEFGDPLQVAHRDRGNALDNRRKNLRVATHGQTQQNRGIQANNTSGFKGVTWHKANQKWMARIRHKGRLLNLGCFPNSQPEIAARAYDAAALEYHGQFAVTNVSLGLLGAL